MQVAGLCPAPCKGERLPLDPVGIETQSRYFCAQRKNSGF